MERPRNVERSCLPGAFCQSTKPSTRATPFSPVLYHTFGERGGDPHEQDPKKRNALTPILLLGIIGVTAVLALAAEYSKL